MKKPEFSLILACYNESEHINKSIENIILAAESLKVEYEIIFVEDKSTDNTNALIKKIIKKYKHYPLKLISHTFNKGRGASVTDGILRSKGRIVGFIDIDCEISADYISQFLNTAEKTDMVVARRIYSFNLFSIHRWVTSKIYALLIKSFFDLPIRDTEAGYKFFQKEKILPVLKKVKDKKWFWDTEIVVRSKLDGLVIKEIPVVFRKRNDKTSTVNIFTDSIEYLKRLSLLWFELRNTKTPSASNFWKNRGVSFSQFYKELSTFSPKNYVRQFLNARTTYLLRLVKNGKLGFVLDVGCGSGVHMSLLIPQSKFVTGIDISEEMINLAKKELKNTNPKKWNLTVGNAGSLPYKSNKFDTVISLGLLDYVKSPKDVLSQCQRVLRSNGLLIITIPKKPSLFSILRSSFGNKVKKALFNLPPVSNILTRGEVVQLVNSSGFKIDSIQSVWTTMWIIKARKI